MIRSRLVLVIVLVGLVACGREASFLPSTGSPSPTRTPTPTAPPATDTPEPTPTPSPTPTPAPTTAAPGSPTAPPPPATPSSGIVGSVHTTADAPVPEAEVTARTEGGEVAGTASTDAAGEFSMRLSPGVYEVTASSPAVTGCDVQRVQVVERRLTPVRITCDAAP